MDKSVLEERCREEGFAGFGVCAPDAMRPAGERLRTWIAEGRHGDMGWFEDRIDWRADAHALWPEARSVIMLADNYGPDCDPLATLSQGDRGTISVYARNRDYHDKVKKRLKKIVRWMVAETGCEVKVFVDTAPVMEKPLAAAAGIGWQGKHTNLVSGEIGSWAFLGAIFTTLELLVDEAHGDQCGSCRACLDVCPTAAFVAPYQLDARRCISYLTIEHKGPVPVEFRAALGNRIYGCDDCLAVCPWNKFAQEASEVAYHARDELRAPKLSELVALNDAAFRAMFSGSPIKRIGRDRFVRNVLYAIGNSRDAGLIASARGLLGDDSEVVRDAAAWAVGRPAQ